MSTKDFIQQSNHESLSIITAQYFKDNFTFCEASEKSLIAMNVPQIRLSIREREFSSMAQILSCFWRLSTVECSWFPRKWHLQRKRTPCKVSAVKKANKRSKINHSVCSTQRLVDETMTRKLASTNQSKSVVLSANQIKTTTWLFPRMLHATCFCFEV